MKANLTKLNNLKEKLQEKLEAMEWAMDERSEKWHESEACEIHEDKMNAIDTAISLIEDAMDELSTAFDLEHLF
jgi:tRNA U54 and U55 pseudouridine synthase Pus10